MATTGHAVIHSVALGLPGGARVGHVVLYPSVRWVGESPRQIANDTLQAAHARWTRAGELLPWLELAGDATGDVRELHLRLPASREPRHPELDLLFHLIVIPAQDGLLVHVPALRVSTWAEDADAVERAATDLIHLEFLREQRLSSGLRLLSTQLFDEPDYQAIRDEPTFYTFGELRRLHAASARSVVGELASRLRVRRRVAFGIDRIIEDLERAVASHPAVLVVGPSGCGKSVAIREAARADAVAPARIWQTTASRMERALTARGGWQSELAEAVAELERSGDWLYVGNLDELFEVGRYAGNDTSLGEALRTPLSNHQIHLIAECTPERLARLDARYPGLVPLFTQVEVREPPPDHRPEIVRLALAQVAPRRGRPDGVRQALRLQQRFQPYSGFPGRTIRFLTALSQRVDGPLDADAVLDGFCAESGLPRDFIDAARPLDIEALRATLAGRVLGQPQAVEAVLDVLLGIKAATTQIGRPMASLLFVGPTGVGKTEMAKALAHVLFGDADRLTRFDMSEYASPGAVMGLIGGADGRGVLTSAVRRQPFSVVLFDEVEKADPSFFDLLLQVLGEGRLSDDRGRFADFCSTVVLLTSNLGASEPARGPVGFDTGSPDRAQAYTSAIEGAFRPELVNRIDRILPFQSLDAPTIRAILDLHLRSLSNRAGLRQSQATLTVHDDARALLSERGFHPEFGARELQRAVRDTLLVPVSDALNKRTEPGPCTVHVRVRGKSLHVGVQEHRRSRDVLSASTQLRGLAERASMRRRSAGDVRDGPVMAELESQLTLLKRSRQRRGDAFWRDAEAAARLARLDQSRRDLMSCFEQAERIEIDTILAAMGPHPDRLDDLRQRSSRQDQELTRCLSELKGHLSPSPPVLLGLYGSDADLLHWHAERYREAMEGLVGIPLRVSTQQVWHLVDPPSESAPYVTRPMGTEPDAELRALVGLELRVVGDAAQELLEGEQGLLRHLDRTPEVELLAAMHRLSHEGSDQVQRHPRLHRRSAFDAVDELRTFGPDDVIDEDGLWFSGAEDYTDQLTSRLRHHLSASLFAWATH